MKHLIFGAILIVMTVIVTKIIRNVFSGVSSDRDDSYHIDDKRYRKYIYNSAPDDFKPHLNQILSGIDSINALVNKYNKEIDQAHYDAMMSIYNKANQIERNIKQYWDSNQFNKDFSFYISLHYASHLLGNALKKEQMGIRDTFVACKKSQEQWGQKIDSLKVQEKNTSYRYRARVSQEIANACRAHKQISILKNKIGETNTKYNQRVTRQHIETANRRDYIANNFGARGRNWKARMKQRALSRR